MKPETLNGLRKEYNLKYYDGKTWEALMDFVMGD